MLSNISNNFKILESKNSSFQAKMDSYNLIKKDLDEVEIMFDNLNNVKIKSNYPNINSTNIDEILDNLSIKIKEINNLDIDKQNLIKILVIKNDLIKCKEFIDETKNVNILVSEEDGSLNDITKKIKDNLLINNIVDESSEDLSDTKSTEEVNSDSIFLDA